MPSRFILPKIRLSAVDWIMIPKAIIKIATSPMTLKQMGLIIFFFFILAGGIAMAGKNDEIKIVENSHLSDDVLRRRYGEFSTAGAKVLTCIKNKESGEQSAIVCENTDWYDILTKKTNYFKGNWRQYTKFMIINYNRCFELSADVFKELSKAYLAPKKDTYEMDRTRGLLYVAKKYLKKFPWSLDDYSISDDQYEHDRSLLRMLLELGLVVRRDCESGKIFIEAKEVDAVNK